MRTRSFLSKGASQICCAALSVLLFALVLSAQNSGGPATGVVTDVTAYGALIQMVSAVDARAQELQSQGTKTALRETIANKLGLPSDELSVFLMHCRTASSAIKDLDARAAPIIEQERERIAADIAAGRMPNALDLPRELFALQRQKEMVIRDAITSLQNHLSQTGNNNVRKYLQSLMDQAIIPTR